MKRKLVYLGAFVLSTVGSMASAGDRQDIKRLFSCDHDDQCVLVEGACPSLVSINKQFRKEAEAYFSSSRRYVECVDPDSLPPDPVSAVCKAYRCEAVDPQN